VVSMSSKLVSCWLLVLALTLAFVATAACNRFDECNSDNDCGAGFKCVKGESAGVVSAACVPTNAPEDAVLLPELLDGIDVDVELPDTCEYECGPEVVGPYSACYPGGAVCFLDCGDELESCDRRPDNGCEVDLRTPVNCGGCGVVCADELAEVGTFGVCEKLNEKLQCVPRGCLPNWVDLGNDIKNGCSFEVVNGPEGTVSTNAVGRIGRANAELLFAERYESSTAHEIMAIRPAGVASIMVDRGNNTTKVSSLRQAENAAGTHLVAVAAGDRPSFLTYTELAGFVEHDASGLVSASSAPLSVAVSGMPATSESSGEFFSLEGNVLRWYSLRPDGFDPGAFACGSTLADSLKLCLSGEAYLNDVSGMAEPLSINAGFGPADTLIVWLSSVERLVEFAPQAGGFSELFIPNSSPTQSTGAVEIEPYEGGSSASFALLHTTGVEFFSYVANSSPYRNRLGGFDFPAQIPANIKDLVPMDNGQFMLVADNGLYFFSALNGSDLFYLELIAAPSGWRYGAYKAGMLDVVRDRTIYHFEQKALPTQ